MSLLQRNGSELVKDRSGQSKTSPRVLKAGEKVFWFFCGLGAAVVIFGFIEEDRLRSAGEAGTGGAGWALYFGLIAGVLLVVVGRIIGGVMAFVFSDRGNRND